MVKHGNTHYLKTNGFSIDSTIICAIQEIQDLNKKLYSLRYYIKD